MIRSNQKIEFLSERRGISNLIFIGIFALAGLITYGLYLLKDLYLKGLF